MQCLVVDVSSCIDHECKCLGFVLRTVLHVLVVETLVVVESAKGGDAAEHTVGLSAACNAEVDKVSTISHLNAALGASHPYHLLGWSGTTGLGEGQTSAPLGGRHGRKQLPQGR